MEKILLTSYGETLKPYGDQNKDTVLAGTIGVHSCGGWVDIKTLSPTHNVIVCRACYLRIVIPNSIKTYGQLIEHL